MEFKSSTYISDRDRIERALQIFLDLEETFKPILDNINELLDLPNLISQFDPDTVALLKDIAENLEEIIKVSTVEFGVDDGYLSWRFATDPDWTPIISMDELKGDVGAGLELEGSVEEYADLPDDLGIEDAGKAYLVEDNGLLYIWDGTSFPSEANGISFVGPPGTSLFSELEDDPKDNTLLRDYLDEKAPLSNAVMTGVLGFHDNARVKRMGTGTTSSSLVFLIAARSADGVDTVGTLIGHRRFNNQTGMLRIDFSAYALYGQPATNQYSSITARLDAPDHANIHIEPISYTYDGTNYFAIRITAATGPIGAILPNNWYVSWVCREVSNEPTIVSYDDVSDVEPVKRGRTVYANPVHVQGPVTAEEVTADGHKLTNKVDKLQTYENRSSNYTITDAETHDVDRIKIGRAHV